MLKLTAKVEKFDVTDKGTKLVLAPWITGENKTIAELANLIAEKETCEITIKSTQKTLEKNTVDCCVTSPPYFGLRDYGVDGQIGLEETPEAYIEKMTEVFREVRRVLKPSGTCWLNIGDSYASNTKGSGGPSLKQDSNAGSRYETRKIKHGVKTKDLIGIPWMLAFALRNDGWYLRQDIIWHKPNPMPESVKDRCTKAHEYIFLLTKSKKYFYDADEIKKDAIGDTQRDGFRGGDGTRYTNGRSFDNSAEAITGGGSKDGYDKRNKRSIWTISTKPYAEAHFATFPPELPTLCIKAGCPKNGVVFDPFAGSGTTLAVAKELGRKFIGIELNPEYVKLIEKRLAETVFPMEIF